MQASAPGALLDGRLAPSIDDVLDLAEPILKHRMALTFSAARGRPHHSRRDQTIEDADRLMAAETSHETREILAIRRAMAKAERSPLRSPSRARARRIARQPLSMACMAGAGRRRRELLAISPFVSGEPSQTSTGAARRATIISMFASRSAEAAHTVWLWARPFAVDGVCFKGRATPSWSAADRYVRTRRIAVSGGERVGIPGLMNPTASRNVIDKMAQAILHDDAARASLPPSFVRRRWPKLSCCPILWSPMSEIS